MFSTSKHVHRPFRVSQFSWKVKVGWHFREFGMAVVHFIVFFPWTICGFSDHKKCTAEPPWKSHFINNSMALDGILCQGEGQLHCLLLVIVKNRNRTGIRALLWQMSSISEQNSIPEEVQYSGICHFSATSPSYRTSPNFSISLCFDFHLKAKMLLITRFGPS
jgi:hypothetical protein